MRLCFQYCALSIGRTCALALTSSAAAVAAGGQTAKKYRLLGKLLSRERGERALGRVGRLLELGRDQLLLAAAAGLRKLPARLDARHRDLEVDDALEHHLHVVRTQGVERGKPLRIHELDQAPLVRMLRLRVV